jgi:hypothetical protein
MSDEAIKEILSKINWDTPFSNDDLYQVFTGKREKIGSIDKTKIYTRILNTFNWYTVMKIIPKEEWPFLLSDNVINKLFPRQLRNKYLHVRTVLFS